MLSEEKGHDTLLPSMSHTEEMSVFLCAETLSSEPSSILFQSFTTFKVPAPAISTHLPNVAKHRLRDAKGYFADKQHNTVLFS